MKNAKVKIFKDSVHGYIEIPSVIVSHIIDTEQFQRLRNIEQTSMRPLFPAARHDRFIHSLGVFYLGTQAFKGFSENSKHIIDSLIERGFSLSDSSTLDDEWWEKQQLLFELACLMHDCAHAPFSHTLEEYYNLKKTSGGIPKLSVLLCEECTKLGDTSFEKDFYSRASMNGVGAPHEKLSSYIILREYKDAIKAVFNDLLNIQPEDVDYAFICRMIIGCRYDENNIESSIKNCIISLLNSSTIDVDGLDYIVRDSQMSGVSTFNIDYQRILNSFTILPVINYSQKKIDNINGIWLAESKFDVNMFTGSISGGFCCIDSNEDQKGKFTPAKDRCVDNSYTYDDFIDKVSIQGLSKGTIRLNNTSKIESSKFRGKASGRKIVSPVDDINNQNITFILGYEKRCLSVIQNTIDARNNEYLWIYTHPKVQYNSSYLQCGLLNEVAKFMCKQQNGEFYEDYITQIMGYRELFDEDDIAIYEKLKEENLLFYRSNDDDLNALFKRIYLQISELGTDAFQEYTKLYREYSSRKQRKVLWKSFMEKEIYPDICVEKGSDFSGIERLLGKAKAEIKNKSRAYTYIDEEVAKIFEKHGITNVLVVCTRAKTKKIDVSEFLVRYDGRCVRLRDVFDSSMFTESVNKEIEYIYYDGETIGYNLLSEIDKELVEYYDE